MALKPVGKARREMWLERSFWVAVLDKDTIQVYLRYGIGQLILDTSLLAVGEQVVAIDPDTVSVKLTKVLLEDEDLVGERVQVSTTVDNPTGKRVYGVDFHDVALADSFIFFLKQEGSRFALARVSSPQSILLGCFRVESEEHLDKFLEAMQLLDRYLVPQGSILADDFAEAPSLPACSGCLFLLGHADPEVRELTRYRCGRIWTPASLKGWLTREALEAYGKEAGPSTPLCWAPPP